MIRPTEVKRQVLIFGPETNKLVTYQLQLFRDARHELNERDIVVIDVDDDRSLYARYRVTEGVFTVILIGKDGTEKLRRNEILPPDELFAIVDAMPMRKAEMRRKQSGKDQ